MSVTTERLAELEAAEREVHAARRRDRERLLHLASYLPPSDRWLIEQVYGRGVPLSALARAEAHGANRGLRYRRRRLARRLTALVRRLRRPAFQLVAIRPELLPRETRAVARHAVLHGRSLRDTARITGISLHRVRRHVRTVHDLARIL